MTTNLIPTFAFAYQTLRYLVTSFVLVGMSAHVLLAGGGDYGLLRLRIIYYDSAWPRTVDTNGAGGQLPPDFCQTSHPYSKQGGQIMPIILLLPPLPGFSYLPTALRCSGLHHYPFIFRPNLVIELHS